MYSFGEQQAVSKLQKWFLEYEISLRSAVVLHLANRNSFGHTKHGKIYVDIKAMPRNYDQGIKKPVRISSNLSPRVECKMQ